MALQPLALKEGVLKDPDNNLTSTVYTKGAWFMQFLEERIGRAEFDAFLEGYFDHFAFQSISSAQFDEYAQANLLDTHPGKVSRAEFDAWLTEPGVPSTAPQTTSERFDAVDAARKAWLESGTLVPAGCDEAVDDAGMGALRRGHAAHADRRRKSRRSTRPTL